ncbi:MAG: right-handed parallel beta-helix repeat-containing protein [Oscillospiraceae bacterium]|nr:right-handed parallel beta-helix repeat-containing protein [Oscillospiraceae bacterium]
MNLREWNIRDYGAVCSDRLQTEKIQKAIDDCILAGGGRVRIPCGVYLTGGIRIRSNVELYLESGAILKGSRNCMDYFAWENDKLEPVTMETWSNEPGKGKSTVATSRWCNGLIRAFDAVNIAVIGEKGSYIDGQSCFDPEGENDYRGPHGMSIWRCKGIRLEGYTFLNSANWCHAIFKSQDITVKNISVFGGHDGIDLRTCDNILIENCNFNTGDDALAGFDNNDVIVRDCTLNSACQAIRFGGNNVLIENCKSDAREFGFRLALTDEEREMGAPTNEFCRFESIVLFSYYCDNRAVLRKPAENIVIRNMHCAQSREIARLEFDGLHRWCCNRSLRHIVFENVTWEDVLRAGEIWGDENEKVTWIFKNCRITCREGSEQEPLFVAGGFEKIVFEDCVIEGYAEPSIWAATDGVVEVIRSTPVRVIPKTKEECLEKHPWGIAREDIGKPIHFTR